MEEHADRSSRGAVGRSREITKRMPGRRFGVVIGIDRYRDERLNLRHAGADAQALYDLMVDPCCGLFAPEDVRLLHSEAATKDAILRALSEVRKKAGPDDDVWIFYAGHAAAEGDEVYWVAHDSDVDDLYVTGMSQLQLGDVLSRIQAKRVLTRLDCCHAAATTVQKNRGRDVLGERALLQAFEGEGRVTLAASKGGQRSVELGELGHGAFTHFLVEGMRGEADLDHDGVVTADELWEYLNGKVREAARMVGYIQTPVRTGEATHQFPISLNRKLGAQQRRPQDLVDTLIGRGPDRLSTDEAEFLISIIEEGGTDGQRALLKDLEDAAQGRLPVAEFRRHITAERRGTVGGDPPPPVPSDVGVKAPVRSTPPPRASHAGRPITMPWIQLELSVDASGALAVAVTGGTGHVATVAQPLAGLTLGHLEAYAAAVQRTARRRLALMAELVGWGEAIYSRVFAGEVGAVVERLRGSAGGGPVLIRLRCADPRLAALPWEAMVGPDGTPLTHHPGFRVVRDVSSMHPAVPREVRGAVRVLAVATSEFAAELEGLRAEVAPLVEAGLVDWLEPVTGEGPLWRGLQQALRRSPRAHVLHFLGHGRMEAGRSELLLSPPGPAETWVSADTVATALATHANEEMRLVYLQSCGSATPAAMASAAERIAANGVEGAVAHLWPLDISAASVLTRAFYASLTGAAGGDLASALNAGRLALAGAQPTAEYASPVFFLRGDDPVLLDFGRRVVTPRTTAASVGAPGGEPGQGEMS